MQHHESGKALDLGPVHTYPDIFENASFFIRFGLASTRRRRFRHQKRSFSKTLSRVDLFENAVFMLSCGRAHGSLGITQGHFDCLFSFVEV